MSKKHAGAKAESVTMWANITPMGFVMAHPKWNESDALARANLGERVVQITVTEIRSKRKGRA